MTLPNRVSPSRHDPGHVDPSSIVDSIIGRLRPAYLGRTPEDATYAIVHELGLLGRRDMTADDPQVRIMAQAIVTGSPF